MLNLLYSFIVFLCKGICILMILALMLNLTYEIVNKIFFSGKLEEYVEVPSYKDFFNYMRDYIKS